VVGANRQAHPAGKEGIMPHKPCCVKCGKEMRPKHTGAGCVEFKEDGSKYKVSACDILECPTCGFEITWGYGDPVHYSAAPDLFNNDVRYYWKHQRIVEVR